VTAGSLHEFLVRAAGRTPDAVAVEELEGFRLTYAELDRLSDRLCDHLRRQGVERGDRVALCLTKSADAIAAIFGILKAGAAYVPLDPDAPAARDALIVQDSGARVLLVESAYEAALVPEVRATGAAPSLLVVPRAGGGRGLSAALPVAASDAALPPPPAGPPVGPADLAYILYTSGSTGRPKGVTLTHGNGISFVDWCSDEFRPCGSERFSLHPPLHFDMSISDVFLSIKHGATIVPIDPRTGRDPFTLGKVIAERRLSFWISVPSILAMLAEHGHLERYDFSALRCLLFAGEVFPIAKLRRLRELLPGPRMYNLYGPTETNVCTFQEIPDRIPPERATPFPIGRACGHAATRVTGPDGADVEPGAEGELCVAGPGVMRGYWNLPERTAQAFLAADGRRWYRTGDIVREAEDGALEFLGRRDRMVKRHGYRIELGEIEAALGDHPAISESAVVATSDGGDVRIRAVCHAGTEPRPSAVEMKAWFASRLPRYMIPDTVHFLDALPRTSTGKVDLQRLKELF
jgi:amino acid adenylation domain-containing protein